MQGAPTVHHDFPPNPSASFLEGQGQESLLGGGSFVYGWYTLGIKSRGQNFSGAPRRESESIN